MLTPQEAQARVRDKRSCYDAFVRNRYYMPPYQDQLVTNKFLVGLRKGTFWLPKADEVKHAVVASKPNKQIIAEELAAQME